MFGYENDELWNTVIKTYPARRHVLDLRQGEVLGSAGLQPGFPALQVLRIATSDDCDWAYSCTSALDHSGSTV